MTISRREKILIIILVLAIFSFLFARLIYIPNNEEIQVLQADNQNLKLEKHKLENMRKQQALAPDAAEKTVTELQSLEVKLPVEEELIPMMRYLDETIKKSDLMLLSLSYKGDQTETESEVDKITFNLGTSGSVFSIINFLQALYDAPRLMSIEDVALTAEKKETPGVSEDKQAAPSYYIPPPGIPEAKSTRYKVEIIPEEYLSETIDKRASDSILRDRYQLDLKITMYYSAGQDKPQEPKEQKDQDGKGV